MNGDGKPWAGRRLHIVGIGGAGMSGLALVAKALGAEVSGSDRAESTYLARVRDAGVTVLVGHAAGNVPAGDDVEVVHSTAITEDNVERVAARERGLPDLARTELLAGISALRPTIAVSGTHGKTTTTSMIVHVLAELGLDPGYLVGGELRSTGSNAGWGAGEWLVVEADESDRSMLSLRRDVAVVTNVELDHHATYASLRELRAAFDEFVAPAEHRIVWESTLIEGDADRYSLPADLVLDARGSSFTWRGHPVRLVVPGAHNALNAVAALEAARLAGADEAGAAAALESFAGAGRRFERVGVTASGAEVFDDYAHHPTEVRATLEAARTRAPERVVAVFQPHLYSRTAALAVEFGAALALADVIVVLDVYRAREDPAEWPGVSGLLVAEAAADAAPGRPVAWFRSFGEAEGYLRGTLRGGDLCLTLGAGDVDRLGKRLIEGGTGAG
jgi:UDP-N-acetylmuramate--alanine ligase